MYKEIKDGCRTGGKSENINQSLPVGLTQTPIGSASMRKLLSSIHVPPSSGHQMQLTVNSGCDDIKAVNTLDMYARREQLKKKSIFLEVTMKIAYNNKPRTNVGPILFQPATHSAII